MGCPYCQEPSCNTQDDSVLNLPPARGLAKALRRIQNVVRIGSKGSQMPLLGGEADSLWDALASVPDHRRAEEKRYPLASLLLIAVAAFLSEPGGIGEHRHQPRARSDAAGMV